MHATAPSNPAALQGSATVNANLTPFANEAANLLGLQAVVSQLHSIPNADTGSVDLRLYLVRRVFTTALEVRAAIDTLDDEICYEFDVLGRMTRSRDHAIAVTNNLNFYQLNVLALIIDGLLGLSADPRWVRASDFLNIVSGLAVGSLAGLTVLEMHGPKRPLPARLNMLGQCLGMAPPEDYRFSPEVWTFINSVPPTSTTGLTRVEQMRRMWKESKRIYPNMDKQAVREKLAAYGPAHTQKSESIKLIKNRLNLLYDVQGLVGLFDRGLADLVR
jgi:hypothetical protein